MHHNFSSSIIHSDNKIRHQIWSANDVQSSVLLALYRLCYLVFAVSYQEKFKLRKHYIQTMYINISLTSINRKYILILHFHTLKYSFSDLLRYSLSSLENLVIHFSLIPSCASVRSWICIVNSGPIMIWYSVLSLKYLFFQTSQLRFLN